MVPGAGTVPTMTLYWHPRHHCSDPAMPRTSAEPVKTYHGVMPARLLTDRRLGEDSMKTHPALIDGKDGAYGVVFPDPAGMFGDWATPSMTLCWMPRFRQSGNGWMLPKSAA